MDPIVFIVIISVLGPVLGSAIGVIVGATAGLMIYITTDEIIPNSCAGSDHKTIFSLLAGIVFVILLGMI